MSCLVNNSPLTDAPWISRGASNGINATVPTTAKGIIAADTSTSARALRTRMGNMGAVGAKLMSSNPFAWPSDKGSTAMISRANKGATIQLHARVGITNRGLRKAFTVLGRSSSKPMDPRFATQYTMATTPIHDLGVHVLERATSTNAC